MMKFAFVSVSLLLASQSATAQSVDAYTPEDLNSQMVYRRAVDAVIWGLPLVDEEFVRQAYFRDGKAKYNDIVWWPKGGGWKNQSPTPTSTRATCISLSTLSRMARAPLKMLTQQTTSGVVVGAYAQYPRSRGFPI